MHSEVAGLKVERVCSSAGWVAFGEEEGASGSEGVGIEGVAGSSWSHFQTAHVSQGAVGIVGNPGVEVGSGGDEIVEKNTAVSVELEEAAAAADIAERVGVQGHEERKVGAGRWLVAGIANTAARRNGEEAVVLVVDVEVGKTVGDAGVAAAAAAASRIGYHHNRSSHKERTVRQEDAVAGQAEEGSIGSCRFRNQAAERDCDLQ